SRLNGPRRQYRGASTVPGSARPHTRKRAALLRDAAPAKASDAIAAIAGVASAAAAGDVMAEEAAKLAKVISLYVNTTSSFAGSGDRASGLHLIFPVPACYSGRFSRFSALFQ